MKTNYLFLLLFILPAVSCGQATKKTSGKNKSTQSDTTTTKKIVRGENGGVPIAMNACHVRAVITKIYTDLPLTKTDSPCDSLPCMADIQIKEVYGIGLGFPAILNAGDVINVHFEFTLMSTEKIFPDIPHLPGLKTDDMIEVNVEARMLPGGSFNFLIPEYKKISNK